MEVFPFVNLDDTLQIDQENRATIRTQVMRDWHHKVQHPERGKQYASASGAVTGKEITSYMNRFRLRQKELPHNTKSLQMSSHSRSIKRRESLTRLFANSAPDKQQLLLAKDDEANTSYSSSTSNDLKPISTILKVAAREATASASPGHGRWRERGTATTADDSDKDSFSVRDPRWSDSPDGLRADSFATHMGLFSILPAAENEHWSLFSQHYCKSHQIDPSQREIVDNAFHYSVGIQAILAADTPG